VTLAIEELPAIPPALIAEVKSFLRIAHRLDDVAIAQFIQGAALLCEDFIGQMLIRRAVNDVLPAQVIWLKLKRLPVQAIVRVEDMLADGSVKPLSASEYVMDIDSDGLGWIRLQGPRSVSRIGVYYQVGLAAGWDDIPAGLEQGIIRLAGHLYTHRDGGEVVEPPSAVTALWRPYRRMRLT